jgi:IS605 OrfB family transposase
MKDTTEAFLEACNQVSWYAVLSQEFSDRKLHQDLYQEIRSTWGLKAQMACSVFRTVSARYKHDHVQERCKRRERGVYFHRRSMPLQLGRDWSLREIKQADGSKKIMFSISTLHGRLLVDGKIGAFQQRVLDDGWRPAGAMLVCRGEEIWLQISIEKEAPAVQSPAPGQMARLAGVDLGQNNLAVLDFQQSHAAFFKGGAVKDRQRKFRRLYQSLQSKGTRGARRKLRRLGGKQRRWQREQNNLLANAVVKEAKDCGAQGIVLENLKGIRAKGKRRTAKHRADFHGWAFGELRQMLEYKAAASGLSIHYVNPFGTSKTCPCCQHFDSNQRDKHVFRCRACQYELHADLVGARNIAQRACA